MGNIYYRGFSSAQWTKTRSFATINIETVKQDLLNHIYTIKGERVMMPDFGTRIPMLTFEPLDQRTMDIIREDLTEVINYDPRVQLIDMKIFALPDNNAIVAMVDLLYVEFKVEDTLRIEIPSGR